jgi:hypothetical protein
MNNPNISKSNSFPNEVEINLDMFGALVLNGVLGHVDSADIVTIYKCRLAKRSVKLGQ